MNRTRLRKPENNETNAARQARLRERRKGTGWRRLSIWLSPDQVDRLERQGGDDWLGRTVKELLGDVLTEPARPQRQSRWRCSRFPIPILKSATVAYLKPGTAGDSLPTPRRRCSWTRNSYGRKGCPGARLHGNGMNRGGAPTTARSFAARISRGM